MPPLLCPPPNLVDQNFPRSVRELNSVRTALGAIVRLLDQEKCELMLTGVLREFITQLDQGFDWSRIAEYPELQVILSILAQFGLQQHGVQTIDVSHIAEYTRHPLPTGCEDSEFAMSWSDELGRLWILHSQHCSPGSYFIGVACARAFAGEPKGTYANPDHYPEFPLVGPDEVTTLDDSCDWEIPLDLHQREVSFDDAYKRVRILGGRVEKPNASSHYQVRFEGKRSWPLDRNLQRIPDRFIKQLQPITGYPFDVIKYVLLVGDWPKRKPRIPRR